VITRPAWSGVGLVLAGLAVAVLWPVTAYRFGPVLLPTLVLAVGAALLILHRPAYGVALAVAIAPLANMPVGGARPLLLLLPAIVAGLLLHGVVTGARFGPRLPGVAVAVLVFSAAFVVSAVQAVDPSRSVTELRWLLIAVGLMVATLQHCQERRELLTVVAGALLGLAFAALHGIFQELTGDVSEIAVIVDGGVVYRIAGAFGHPNQYAGYLATFMPLAGAFAVGRHLEPRLRLLGAAAFGLALFPLVFTLTRGAIAGLVVGTLVWIAVVRPRAALAAVVVTVAAGALFAPATLQERFEGSSGGDVTLRSDIWGAALDIFAQRPILGAGPDNFADAYETLPSASALRSQRRLLHTRELLVPPHAQNLYLNVLAEQGIVGVLAFLLLAGTAVTVCFRATRARDPAARAVGLGLGAGLLVLAVHSLLEVNLFGERAEMPLFALLAVAATFVWRDRSATAA
jgi:O-antigen ligase